nr:hypothetical protein Iba_chr11dCG8270 [Ipomoea batatas]
MHKSLAWILHQQVVGYCRRQWFNLKMENRTSAIKQLLASKMGVDIDNCVDLLQDMNHPGKAVSLALAIIRNHGASSTVREERRHACFCPKPEKRGAVLMCEGGSRGAWRCECGGRGGAAVRGRGVLAGAGSPAVLACDGFATPCAVQQVFGWETGGARAGGANVRC